MIKGFLTNPTCVSLSVLAIALGCSSGDDAGTNPATTAGGGFGGDATSNGGVGTNGGATSGGGVTSGGGFGTAGVATGTGGGIGTGGGGPGAGGRNFGGTFNGAGGNTTPPGPDCGNGRVDTGEDCDGRVQQGQTCATASMGALTRGFLRCAANCTFDLGRCRTGDGAGGQVGQGGDNGQAGADVGGAQNGGDAGP